MQNTIIIYEPVEEENSFSVDDLNLYEKRGGDTKAKSLEFYVNFFE